MKKGFWKGITKKCPVLLLAVAVTPAAMAQAPIMQVNNSAETAAIAVDPNAVPATQPTAMTTMTADPSCVPGAAVMQCSPCQCSPCGCPDSGVTFQWAPDKWCNVGAGIRTSFNSIGGDVGTGGSNSIKDHNFFAVDEARLFFTGKVTKVIGFELNTDITGAGGEAYASNNSNDLFFKDSIHLLDAIVKFEFSDAVNFWVGRFLPPSDRQNLDGPFFLNGWTFPFVQNYPQIFEGRDDGVMYWGQAGGGQLHWAFGLFNGNGLGFGQRAYAGNDWPIVGPSGFAINNTGNPEFAMRLQVDLLDPEPGYYTQSTYYGQKDILAFGFAMQDQVDAAVDGSGRVGTFNGWNVEGLFENKMTEWGSVTLEAAFYRYTIGSGVDNAIAGNAGFIFAGWLLPQEIGCCGLCGHLRPYVKWQKYDYSDVSFASSVGAPREGWDVGTQYVIKGHNARLDLLWGERDLQGGGRTDFVTAGMQLIF